MAGEARKAELVLCGLVVVVTMIVTTIKWHAHRGVVRLNWGVDDDGGGAKAKEPARSYRSARPRANRAGEARPRGIAWLYGSRRRGGDQFDNDVAATYVMRLG